MAGMLNGACKAALAQRACPRFSARRYFCLRVNKFSQKIGIFIINYREIIYTEMALFHTHMH
jgi:hypothetical protein